MAVVWDEDIEATFIEAFRERTCLYDKTDVNFKDKDLKQQAWEEVASKCKVTGEWEVCLSRWLEISIRNGHTAHFCLSSCAFFVSHTFHAMNVSF